MAKQKKANNKKKKTGKAVKSDTRKEEQKKDNNDFYDDELEDYNDNGDENYEEVEDNIEFMDQVKEFEKQHQGSKIVNVYELIGKPAYKKFNKLNEDSLKKEYKKMLSLLDTQNIIVHFKNDYPIKEKYRFITEEIFSQDVEDVKNTNLHINFIYEDFHPEMDEDDDEY